MAGFRYDHYADGDIYLGAYKEWDLYTDRERLYLLANRASTTTGEIQCDATDPPRATFGLTTFGLTSSDSRALEECRKLYVLRFQTPDPSVSPNSRRA